MTTAETKAKYFEAVGRRKTSIARVRMTPDAKQSVTVNDRKFEDYFKTADLRATAIDALEKTKLTQKFKVTVNLVGGGISGQAGALRHGISRALLVYDKELRKKLKKLTFLTRDPRAKERRKFGLKKARKSPQWSKR